MCFSRSLLFTALFAFRMLPACGANIDVVFYDNRFGVLDDVTGDYRQIGTLPLSVSSGIAYFNGMYYLEDAGYNLLSVDASTGAAKTVGATGIGDAAAVFGGGVNGLYEVDIASNLYKLESSSGKATLVGATGLAANNGGFDTSMSSDGKSLYYTAGGSGANDELYRIDITTGVAADLGSTGVTGIAGSAYVNGNLELYQYGQSSNYIYSASAGSLKFARGAALGVQIIDGGAINTALSTNSTTSPAAAPEPASLVLLGGGFLFLGWRGRSKRKKRSAAPPHVEETPER